ncbi:MAG TPA: type II secretion system F family protein [Patescibacteria group bacterium]|nr:type II secretion system F family protein [Patescibacteria group bacterium]
MPTFVYKVKDNEGRDIKGTVEAQDRKQAISILREKRYFPYFIRQQSEGLFVGLYKRLFKKVSLTEVSTFTRQLSTMINAGLPLTEALTILKSQRESQLTEAVGAILRDVEGGASLADALQKHPKIFSTVYVSLVKAGESAGVLDNILGRLADNLEMQREFQAKIKGALLYPIIIVVGMGGVMFMMMVFVIPKLTALYTEFDAQLPQATKILISISRFMVSFWWLLIFLLIGLAYLYRAINRDKEGKKRIDEIKFKIPIFGKLQIQIALAELTRTLGLLVGAGISIVEALEISSKTADNAIIEEGVLSARKQVEKGFPLSSALSENRFFPQILSQMLSVGEETGKVDEVMLKVSHYFQSESEESLKGLTTAIEPLIMILLGVGVGFLVIAIIMPIYNLTSQF